MATLIQLLLRLLAVLPLRLAHSVGAGLGHVLARVPNKRLSTTDTNLALCFPDLSAEQRRKLATSSLIETGKGVAETSALWQWSKSRTLDLVRHTSGLETLRQAYEEAKGVIIAAPHLGAWEMIGLYCSAHYPMSSLYRPPPLAGMDRAMRAARERLGARLVATNSQGVRVLYKALAQGEMVGILPDQDPAGGTGVFAPFFGRQANTMVLLSRLAAKTGAAVIFAFAERLPRGQGYHLHYLRAASAINDPDVMVSAGELNRMVEQCVRMLPQQYLWCYKRFRTRPDGEHKLYRR